MAWEKTSVTGSNALLYTCTEGALKGSKIMIIRQEQLDNNRYCSITLKLDYQFTLDKLNNSMREKRTDISPHIADLILSIGYCTFEFHEGDDKSRELFSFIKLINDVCPLGIENMQTISNNLGKSFAEKNFAEIRKNARVIYQLANAGTLFRTLPDAINAKIASFTRGPNTYTEQQAEKIAINHFCKPSL